MSINIDARGLACPRPVIATKKALAEIVDGVVTIVVDNLAAKENVSKFAAANQCEVTIQEKDGVYSIAIVKGQGMLEETVPQPIQSDTAFLITQRTMGHGSTELGQVLIKSFFMRCWKRSHCRVP